ncbi:MAG: hypothetical protein ACHQLQ_03995 [Candidatus Acidiferrales bacterium]
MSANRSVDRSAIAHKKDRSAVAQENDRSSLCSFSFADGRRCRTPRCPSHPHLCFFHARKEAQALAAQQMGRDIASDLSGSYLSACDLSSALGRLFSAVAQGQVKPKTASTLAYLGQTLLQSIQFAQHEYINAFGTDSWRRTIRSSFAPSSPAAEPGPEPDLLPSATLSSK